MMGITTVNDMQRKVKITVEYPKGYDYGKLGFATFDLSKVVVNVILKGGGKICQEDIQTVSIRARREGE